MLPIALATVMFLLLKTCGSLDHQLAVLPTLILAVYDHILLQSSLLSGTILLVQRQVLVG